MKLTAARNFANQTRTAVWLPKYRVNPPRSFSWWTRGLYELVMLRDQPGLLGRPFLTSSVLQLRRLDAAVEMLDSSTQSARRDCITCRLVRPEANK